jgi:lysophospholipase L1-like esterase
MRHVWLIGLLVAGCSSATMNGVGGGGGGDDGGSGGSGADGGGTLAPANYGTYIALGDSISDRGGVGPFFYDLLNQDLTAKYPGLMFVHAAIAGSVAGPYTDGATAGQPTLESQVSGLASSYPGDVLVTITIGGNDLNGHAQAAITMTDTQARMDFASDLASALGELTKPGRLGTGKLRIVLANIYDFTDGMGDFSTVRCGPGINISSARDALGFTNWNAVMATAAQNAGGAIYDMHADFMGHGYNATNPDDIWFAGGNAVLCIHPNAKGHDAIRRAIYKMVTGATL